jgi:hypothetical protein
MTHPSTTKRGADPHLPKNPEKSRDTDEHKLEQGLEESMAGSGQHYATGACRPQKTLTV